MKFEEYSNDNSRAFIFAIQLRGGWFLGITIWKWSISWGDV